MKGWNGPYPDGGRRRAAAVGLFVAMLVGAALTSYAADAQDSAAASRTSPPRPRSTPRPRRRCPRSCLPRRTEPDAHAGHDPPRRVGRRAGGAGRGAHAGDEDGRRPRDDRAGEPRPGDAVPARGDAVRERAVGQRHDRRLRVLQRARHRPDAAQHHARRRPAPGPRGPGPLLLELRRLPERRRLDPGPARRRHFERRGRVLRRLGELRERQPRREGRARCAGRGRVVGERARVRRPQLGPRRPVRVLRPLRRADERRVPRALRRRPAHPLLRCHAPGRPLAPEALRLLGPREEPARLPRHGRSPSSSRTCATTTSRRTRRTTSARTSCTCSTRGSWARRRR